MAQAVTGHDEAVMLDAAHLSRSFGTRLAVDDVSFHVAPGETYGLLGPNGAGKTTTIRLVCGLLSADSDQITVSGMPVSTSTTTAKAQIPRSDPATSSLARRSATSSSRSPP